MKIAILADPLDFQTAGVHTYTKQLINAIIKYDTENEYIIIREKVDIDLNIEQIAIPSIRLPIGFASLRLFFIIPLILRFKNVDVVFEPAHFGPFNLPKRIKRLTMIHDLTPILFPHFHKLDSQLLQRLFLKRILKKTDLVFSNSQNTTQDLINLYPVTKNKVRTILLGRDEDFYNTDSKEYLYNNSIANQYFLITGTIEPRKNINVLLEAFSLFRKKYDQKVLLIIVGKEGWKNKDFHSKLSKHEFREDIILTGFVKKKELIELYSNAMALVYPSLYEGFGLPIVEALSCGTQVICSNASSLPEVGGEVALYFDPDDVNALETHLHFVATNIISISAQKDVFVNQAKKFSWKKYIKSFEKALKE